MSAILLFSTAEIGQSEPIKQVLVNSGCFDLVTVVGEIQQTDEENLQTTVYIVTTTDKDHTPIGNLQSRLYKQDRLFWISLEWSEEAITRSVLENSGKSLSACVRLEKQLASLSGNQPVVPKFQLPMLQLIQSYVTLSLAENILQRTGKMRRFAAVVSDNEWKVNEYRVFFGQYGIEVLQFPKIGIDHEDAMVALLRDCKTPTCVPLCIFRETSRLLKPSQNSEPLRASTMRDGVDAEHQARLSWWYWDNQSQSLTHRETSHCTKGYISLSKRQRSCHEMPSFGWDSVFVLHSIDMSYQEMAERHLKVSSRDMVLSLLVQQRVHYRKPRNLTHMPLPLTRSVDFRQTVREFLKEHELLDLPSVRSSGMHRLLHRVLDQGVFFRAPTNRRIGNFWFPSLNAGLPLVPKRDGIHELTYMIHDCGHMRMPDLVPTHNAALMDDRDALQLERLYIVYRMMSEAITLVLADYVFVDALVKDREQLPEKFKSYDFGARCIWPFFDALQRPVNPQFGLAQQEQISNLHDLLYANVRFVLCGDDAPFQSLMEKLGPESKANAEKHFEAYRKKYIPFFIEDYRWTIHNQKHMTSHHGGKNLSSWWDSTREMRQVLEDSPNSLPIESVTDYQQSLLRFEQRQDNVGNDLVDRVFQFAFVRDVVPSLFSTESTVQQPSLSAELQTLIPVKLAFARYMTGQMILFTRYSVPKIQNQLASFQLQVMDHFRVVQSSLDLNTVFVEIDKCRAVFEDTLDFLLSCNLISPDDVATFKEVVPIFSAFYVSYDQLETSNLSDLRSYWKKTIQTSPSSP
jgi:adenylate kinase